MIFRLLAIALLDLPEAVIVPGQDMVRVRLQRALIPDLRKLVVAELAVGIADQVRDIGIVVMTKGFELVDRRHIVMTVIDRRIGLMVTANEGGIAEEGLLGRLLALVARARVGRRALLLRRRRR